MIVLAWIIAIVWLILIGIGCLSDDSGCCCALVTLFLLLSAALGGLWAFGTLLEYYT